MTIEAPPIEAAISEYELERGKPSPGFNHSTIEFNTSVALAPYRDRLSVCLELSLDLPGAPRPQTPDISVYLKRAMDLGREIIKMTEPPLLVIEILSATQSLDELSSKALDYLNAGVKASWIIVPSLRAVAVRTSLEQPRKLYDGGEVTDETTGITVWVEDLFAS